MATETVEVVKNASETLRVERTEYLGKDLVAVRVFTGRPGDPDARPTRKGLTLRPDTWQELLPAIRAALEGAPQRVKQGEPDALEGVSADAQGNGASREGEEEPGE